MKVATTRQDIFNELKLVFTKFKHADGKLSGLITGEALAMTGKHKGFVSLMLKSMPFPVMAQHCIIHQEQLCAKTLEIKYVMGNVVKSQFHKVEGTQSQTIPIFSCKGRIRLHRCIYFNQVRWLCRASTLARYWSLLEEIKTFMTIKGKDVSFLDDDQWLNDLAFLVLVHVLSQSV